MRVNTSRLGEVDARAEDIVLFVDGLPGFDDKRFVLLPQPGARRVLWLQSLSDPDLALMTVDPIELRVDFEPHFKPGETLGLKLTHPSQLECRVIARTPPSGGVWLNLFAPLLFHRAAGLAMQLPLVGSGYGQKTPWPAPPGSDNVDGP